MCLKYTWTTFKTLLTFHRIGWFREILISAYCITIPILPGCTIPSNRANKQGFGHCSRETTVISPQGLPPWRPSPVSGFHQAAGVEWFILPRLSTLFHLLHVQRLPGVRNRTLQHTGQSTTSPKPEWKGNFGGFPLPNYHNYKVTSAEVALDLPRTNFWRQTY